jgi:hypothetical protein
VSCEIHQTVWTKPEDPEEQATLIGTVAVRMNEIELVLPDGAVLYRASLEQWAASMLMVSGGPK